jgi:hypothetical protein
MKKDQVRIGETYTAKVSGGIAPVRITQEVWLGELQKGWKGINTETGRSVRVKSAQRLRARVGAKAEAPAAPKAARLPAQGAPTAGDVGHGGGGAAEGAPTRKAASPRPPKAASAPKGKAKKKAQVRPTKGSKRPVPRKPKEGRPLSGLDAAAKLLSDTRKSMQVGAMIEQMASKGLWESKAGKTPAATIYAAIIREIHDKGVESRFKKLSRGVFAAAGK